MIEKWIKFLGEGSAFGVLLRDLSKAFHCLRNKLLIAKVHAYEINIPSLKLKLNQKQKAKLVDKYSFWSKIILGVPQGSILGPVLFIIFLCNVFQLFPDLDITNYADDNIPHSANINLNKVLHDLEKITNTLLKWFNDDLLKANQE